LISLLAIEGWRITIVTATDGRKGTLSETEEDLIQKRAQEAIEGARILGADPPVMLGHPDGELDCLPAGKLREQFIRLIRQYRPGLIICQDPFYSEETHRDHRACAWAAEEAIESAYLPLIHPEHAAQGLAPHAIREKYFYTAPGSARVNRVIDTSRTIEQKIAAMLAHRTQITFFIEEMMLQARHAGLDPETLLVPFGGDYGAAIAWSIRATDGETGNPAHYAFGEAYHYQRYHPVIETFLAAQNSSTSGETL
jgi:N-acetyl-1-D-myo-inositol-2-amino-2-deoxy-alpha-D-glucopyranoside deacetylase